MGREASSCRTWELTFIRWNGLHASKESYKQRTCRVQDRKGGIQMLTEKTDLVLTMRLNIGLESQVKGLSPADSPPWHSLAKDCDLSILTHHHQLHICTTSHNQPSTQRGFNRKPYLREFAMDTSDSLKCMKPNASADVSFFRKPASVISIYVFHRGNEMSMILICAMICLSILILVLMASWIKAWSLFVLFKTTFFYLK